MLGPENVMVSFANATTATSGADGQFRIKLSGFPFGPENLPATGSLRYLVLAHGFHSEVGKIDPGQEPATLNLRLSAEEWAAMEIRVVDREGKPVDGAELSIQLGSNHLVARDL